MANSSYINMILYTFYLARSEEVVFVDLRDGRRTEMACGMWSLTHAVHSLIDVSQLFYSDEVPIRQKVFERE